MRAVPIETEGGSVAPSIETVTDGTYQPLSRPLFIYVNTASTTRPEVRSFIEFYLTQGPGLAAEVGFVSLPAGSLADRPRALSRGPHGTVFGGSPEVGVTIEELLERDATL